MIDGVLVKKLVRHPDERGFLEEIIAIHDPFFTEGFGQLTRTRIELGVVKAWHIHKTQIDWWYVINGTINAVLFDRRKKEINEFIMGDGVEDIVLKIPAGVAHGLKVIKGPVDFIYVTSVVYNKEEEGRIPHDDPSIGYDWIQGIPITNKKIF